MPLNIFINKLLDQREYIFFSNNSPILWFFCFITKFLIKGAPPPIILRTLTSTGKFTGQVYMRSYTDNIKTGYFNILHLFFSYSLIILFIHFLYRIRIYNLIETIYPELNQFSLGSLIYISLFYDSIAILISLLILLTLLIFVSNKRKSRYIVPSSFIVIQLLYLLFSINFFRLFETSFQKSYLGREHLSGIKNLFSSFFAEIGADVYIYFIVITSFIALISILISRWDKRYDFSEIISYYPGSKFLKIFKYYPAFFISIFIITGVFSISGNRYKQIIESIKLENKIETYTMLHELSLNPVSMLIFPGQKEQLYTKPSKLEDDTSSFSFKFNTDSMESDKINRRIEIIPRGENYNIILYFFESTAHKYLDIKINGKYVAETWHKLSKNSLNIRNHYANYPLSANAMLSVMSSAYDMNRKNMAIQEYPNIKLKTISEILKENGYRTCLIHTGDLGYAGQNRFLKNRKFDKIINFDQLKNIPPYNIQVGWGFDERAMIKPALDFIKEDEQKPYFIVFLPVNPHHPYAIPNKKFQITGEIPKGINFKKRNWLRYLNSLHYSDASLGMLVDEMEKKKFLSNTLLFLFADHGEAFYQHRMNYNHPLFLYEENTHVPYLIYNKNLFSEEMFFDGISRHIDITPTILDILNIPPMPEQEGISLLSAHRKQLALLHASWKDDLMGIRDGKWKYIIRLKDMTEELYNLEDDINEKKNIASENREITNRYKKYVLKARKYKDEYYKRILKR